MFRDLRCLMSRVREKSQRFISVVVAGSFVEVIVAGEVGGTNKFKYVALPYSPVSSTCSR